MQRYASPSPQGLTNAWSEHLAVKHFEVEGQIGLKGLLYVPKEAPFDLFDQARGMAVTPVTPATPAPPVAPVTPITPATPVTPITAVPPHRTRPTRPTPSRPTHGSHQTAKGRGLRLYVRRIFVLDNCNDLCPEWLGFLRGVVDSDDLPLNVSREMLQQSSRLMRLMRKQVVRSAIEHRDLLLHTVTYRYVLLPTVTYRYLPLHTVAYRHTQVVRKAIELLTELSEDSEKYAAFYESFSKNLKLGVHEDEAHRPKLAGLLRFRSSRGGDDLVSLADYVGRMAPNQTEIYYLAAESVEAAVGSPFMEAFNERGLEVPS